MAGKFSDYYDKFLRDKSITHHAFDNYILNLKKNYETLENYRQFTGLITIKAKINNDQII